ncbi:hypothetical protein EJ02DRAFT_116233 [Clathrospora elynae]|uniref:Uncharacterized protein n=1 Tax=Clathrospora elynae TaxID=706981 RepID=A0A6A5S6M2_9PLEO|nr:hypothetical protein EJ02DRAFT_116233 [Clathrospora elynae]
MATPKSPNPIYHDPVQTRRRSSSHKSVASSPSRSASHADFTRTSIPMDGDAFSYNPSHLSAWYLSQDLWDRLPVGVQSSLASVQHSGAAVLTGFERLDKHTADTNATDADQKAPVDELLIQLNELPTPKLRTVSNASSALQSDRSAPLTDGSSAPQSGSASPATPTFDVAQLMSSASPASLGSPALSLQSYSCDRSFITPPLDRHGAYFATELSHLRTEALPRLRHQSYKVDQEWSEAKCNGAVTAEDVNTFENWWVEKKCTILSLNEKGKRLATAVGLAKTGLGWSAP